jgi:glutathione S-transferase
MIEIFGDKYSGNCYKVKLLAHLLDMRYAWRHVDVVKRETRTEAFLKMNPNGKIPIVRLEDGRCLTESNAILNYFASDSEFLPEDNFARYQVLQWQFFEQYSHEPLIASSRYIVRYLGTPDERKAELESLRAGGYAALQLMDEHLTSNTYFVENRYSIADISLYAYTHVADEGGFSLDPFENIRAWISRIESHPRHVTMGQDSK